MFHWGDKSPGPRHFACVFVEVTFCCLCPRLMKILPRRLIFGSSLLALYCCAHLQPLSPEQEKYARVLFDFRYLKSPETFESEIERDLVRSSL
jgi:hypothetical protein